ncbi:hypothetical protein P2G74_01615 [Cronobacter muytjensii]|uniref:hypothetical protein n=1 Tax=Cronobacter muytjensii TaxID=413501 RepID=UPI002DB88016|nr:hypothetical protein [Cronobacter muytjensii]MEB8638670.1 hypothetical protein [Cronobacter muytjensii]
MGFPSPASDFIQKRVTLDGAFDINNSSVLIATSAGWAVVQRELPVSVGSVIAVSNCGELQFAVVHRAGIVTSDGNAIEGEALNELDVIGVVTVFANRVGAVTDDLPVM